MQYRNHRLHLNLKLSFTQKVLGVPESSVAYVLENLFIKTKKDTSYSIILFSNDKLSSQKLENVDNCYSNKSRQNNFCHLNLVSETLCLIFQWPSKKLPLLRYKNFGKEASISSQLWNASPDNVIGTNALVSWTDGSLLVHNPVNMAGGTRAPIANFGSSA